MGFSRQWVGPFLRWLMVGSFVLMPSLSSAQDAAGISAEALKGRPYSPYADRAFPTDVYFGDTHVHTALSADAGGGGTKLLPRDAYRFARGEQVMSNTGQPVKLRQPLDFYMITDHSDGMGVITDLIKGTPEILADPVARQFHEAFAKGGKEAAEAAYKLTAMFSQGKVPATVNYQPGNPAFKRVWNDIVQAAKSSTSRTGSRHSSRSNGHRWSRATTCTATSFFVMDLNARCRFCPTRRRHRSAAAIRATCGSGWRTTKGRRAVTRSPFPTTAICPTA